MMSSKFLQILLYIFKKNNLDKKETKRARWQVHFSIYLQSILETLLYQFPNYESAFFSIWALSEKAGQKKERNPGQSKRCLK